ncbi:MAG: UDP-3-O-(3-hydroxymyristoyl)glucosamine N-acyltransferase [Phycisphaeraceae bacterium]
MKSLTASQIAELTGGRTLGATDTPITGLETLDFAGPNDLTFIGDAKHAERWPDCKARIALIDRKLVERQAVGLKPCGPTPGDNRALIAVDHVDLAMAKILEHFAPPPQLPGVGVHPSCVIDPAAKIGAGCRVGPHCVLGPRATLGPGCTLHSGVTIMDDSSVGAQTEIFPGVVIRERCHIGAGCLLSSNVVIGTDGFGYRPSPDGRSLVKIPHIGGVRIGDAVELGANTCVDRGKFSDTVIGDGTKIDNLVQIAHNCRIGRCVVIAGCTGVAGSTTIGDGVQIGGGADIKDHLTIGPGAKIAGGAQLMHDVPPGETWAGSPAQEHRNAARQYVAMRQLPELMKKAKKWMKE